MANQLDAVLYSMKDMKATDLHLTAGQVPKLRIHGSLAPAEKMDVLTDVKTRELMAELVTEAQWQRFLNDKDYDFAYSLPGYARFRTNFYFQEHGVGAVFRMIPEKLMTFEELGLPTSVLQFVEMGWGLVLVTGPTGSGKTTTLASIIDYINEKYKRHIVTLEDPIEFLHHAKQSLITSRELGSQTHSFASALRIAMRMDPNVILVGEMRDPETISLALTCAEMGILVFATLHTNSASKTVDRIVDVFTAVEQARIRTMLAGSLRGVVAQQLLLKAGGKGRVASFEILVATPAVGAAIRSGESNKIDSMIESGGKYGMQTMDSHIKYLLGKDIISGEEAYQKAFNKSAFEQYWQFG
jgi:twitching motility protein PilT